MANLNSLLEHPQFTDLLVQRGLIEKKCYTCRWFILREEKPRNRVCRYPKKLSWDGIKCLCWELEPNPNNRVKAFCGH